MTHILRAPLENSILQQLKAGDEVLVQGTVYAARDAAHQKMIAALESGDQLPFDITGQIIYYVGPCPAPPGRIIGSAGPTTSSRMDVYTPALLARGLKAMIGKGDRSQIVKDAMIKYGAVYLAAVGGAGVYLSRRITSVEIVAYPELGPEALLKMEFKDFPCIVAIDNQGNSVYKSWT
ncbi:MAG TPA: FumA C-terminus/TtdB family hydratase beta subunit [Syntrophomonadaceae bacterium]|nr:FumA C-terminus/TtdB family hydratase beta subunit [Syntrophomonadaceae bacterium]HQA06560.1 FumA C-terminus/TtdB family hydratase beta subunit [Syntrophomonadaceae bacterium]HQE22459.1 FumA C-terminus/TtdB family hydratase beta subunit [Syntrophomonadaceae bacterium]